jgi:ABC-type antimicrobial peptide transport system permease subunit
MKNTSTVGSSFVKMAGLLCLVGAIIGLVSALVTAFIPPAVSFDRFSYPYTPTGFLFAHFVFMSNHVLLLVGIYSASPSPVPLVAAFSGAWGCGSLSSAWPRSRCARYGR